ncbi:adenylate/guanylate cyclase domain-containing protein [Calditrichota bacterium GD2]
MDLELLKNALIRLFHRGFEKEKIQKLFNFLVRETSPQHRLFYPNLLGVRINFAHQETLKLVTYGVLDGLFEMTWQVFCPQCTTPNFETKSLKNLRLRERCAACGFDYEPHADQNVHVVLALHPRFYDEVINTANEETPVAEAGVQPLTVLDLMGYPDFREHFTDQAPRLNQAIKIRNVSVMFTDLIRSTEMYEVIGDVQAFLLVNEHFDILFDFILKKYGGVIKTIGDAVMAVFKEPAPAFEAAVDIKKRVDHFLKSKLKNFSSGIKIGLHVGPAVVVNLNENFDLFGATVNKAARLVSHAQLEAIAMSKEFMAQVHHLPETQNTDKITQNTVTLKGIKSEQLIYLYKVR